MTGLPVLAAYRGGRVYSDNFGARWAWVRAKGEGRRRPSPSAEASQPGSTRLSSLCLAAPSRCARTDLNRQSRLLERPTTSRLPSGVPPRPLRTFFTSTSPRRVPVPREATTATLAF